MEIGESSPHSPSDRLGLDFECAVPSGEEAFRFGHELIHDDFYLLEIVWECHTLCEFSSMKSIKGER
jgi:hypothetical protein